MSTKNAQWILIALVVAAFVVGAFFYPQFPERVATHWSAAGEADGYMNKTWGVFLLPLVMAGLFALYRFIPVIDPLKTNIESFRRYYDGFWIFLSVFLLYLFGLQTAWNLGARFNFSAAMIPAVALFWYGLGIVLKKSKRNWFVGIRTPWTLSSDAVWERTHRLGAKLCTAAAILSLSAFFFEGKALVAALVLPAAAVAAATIVYSYLEYRRMERGKDAGRRAT